MIDEFLDWFLGDFMPGILETIRIVLTKAVDVFFEILAWIIFGVIAIIAFPIWIIPFAFWCLTEWKGNDNGKE